MIPTGARWQRTNTTDSRLPLAVGELRQPAFADAVAEVTEAFADISTGFEFGEERAQAGRQVFVRDHVVVEESEACPLGVATEVQRVLAARLADQPDVRRIRPSTAVRATPPRAQPLSEQVGESDFAVSGVGAMWSRFPAS